jgi:hypothetical protein
MQPPTTFYPHGNSNNRHGSSTSVKSYFLLPISGWAVKPVTIHAMPSTIPPLITLEGEYDGYRTPKFPGLGLIHSPSTHLNPSSTRPRPTAGQQGRKADVTQDPKSFHRLILYVTMVSGDGRSFSGHVATAASTALDKTSLLRHPDVLPPLDPIKGQAGDSTKGDRGQAKKACHHPTVEDQHLKQSPLYSHFSL